MKQVLKVDARDNVAVALVDLNQNTEVNIDNAIIVLQSPIPKKHKFALQFFKANDKIVMYGVIVGFAKSDISQGGLLNTSNVEHSTASVGKKEDGVSWRGPSIEGLPNTFQGYKRGDGRVGIANYWLVVPMVFCQNRNLQTMKESLLSALGYLSNPYDGYVEDLIEHFKNDGGDTDMPQLIKNSQIKDQVFKGVDGVKFLNHNGGCGGDRKDSQTLVQLLAGYIAHGNVAGATILGLGCEHAQFEDLKEAIFKISPNINKPLYFISQQEEGTEENLMKKALSKTIQGLAYANELKRETIDAAELIVGVECGGSDGFSGISSNVVLGEFSDLLVQQKGSSILAEFPELCGVEQEIINRCVESKTADRFISLMEAYENLAKSKGSSFSSNPSPGNIKDGLITDAMKSAGAVRKGGTSSVVDVLDYTEPLENKGLNLLCTPGNDVESTTGLAASGAHLILFSTGLGTPTGNPIAPVVKVSSNTALFQKMFDIIDFDAGSIISGEKTPQQLGRELYQFCFDVINGEQKTKAQKLLQDDFLLWKRGVSL